MVKAMIDKAVSDIEKSIPGGKSYGNLDRDRLAGVVTALLSNWDRLAEVHGVNADKFKSELQDDALIR